MIFEKSLNFRLATLDDREAVLEMMRLYYEDDRLPYDRPIAEAAFLEFIADETLGRFWVFAESGNSKLVGYLALPFGYSFEYGGREGFVDELYVEAESRGKGFGSAAIRYAESQAARLGLCAVRLEVTAYNPRAAALYLKLGFTDTGRSLLSLPLKRSGKVSGEKI